MNHTTREAPTRKKQGIHTTLCNPAFFVQSLHLSLPAAPDVAGSIKKSLSNELLKRE